jgi:hypothetical protein
MPSNASSINSQPARLAGEREEGPDMDRTPFNWQISTSS